MPRGVSRTTRDRRAETSAVVEQFTAAKASEFQRASLAKAKDSLVFFEDVAGRVPTKKSLANDHFADDSDSDGPGHLRRFADYSAEKELRKAHRRSLTQTKLNNFRAQSKSPRNRRKAKAKAEAAKDPSSLAPVELPVVVTATADDPDDVWDMWGAARAANSTSSSSSTSTSSIPSSSSSSSAKAKSKSKVPSKISPSTLTSVLSARKSAAAAEAAAAFSFAAVAPREGEFANSRRTKKASSGHWVSAAEFSRKALPHSGTSYNPNEESRLQVVNEALKRNKAEQKEFHLLHNAFTQARERDEEHTREGALEEGDDEKEKVDDDDEREKVEEEKDEKKTRGARHKKVPAIGVSIRDKRIAKAAKKSAEYLDRGLKDIPRIMTAIKNEEKEKRKKAQVQKESGTGEGGRVLRLGKYRAVPSFPAVALADDLAAGRGLLSISPAASLLDEQFKRFEARNMMEPRKRIKAKDAKPRYKKKFYKREKETCVEADNTPYSNPVLEARKEAHAEKKRKLKEKEKRKEERVQTASAFTSNSNSNASNGDEGEAPQGKRQKMSTATRAK